MIAFRLCIIDSSGLTVFNIGRDQTLQVAFCLSKKCNQTIQTACWARVAPKSNEKGVYSVLFVAFKESIQGVVLESQNTFVAFETKNNPCLFLKWTDSQGKEPNIQPGESISNILISIYANRMNKGPSFLLSMFSNEICLFLLAEFGKPLKKHIKLSLQTIPKQIELIFSQIKRYQDYSNVL